MKEKKSIQKRALTLMVLVFYLMLGFIAAGETMGQVDPMMEGGEWHTVSLKSDGTVWAWGSNYAGQLGDGTVIDKLTPVQVSVLTNAIAVAAGYWAHAGT